MEQRIDFQERFLGKRYTVSFPFELYMKMKAFFQHFDEQKLESVVWGKVEKKDNTILITDIVIPCQIISGVTVDIDNEKNLEDDSVLGCNLSIHSHHTMGAFFSGKDEENIRLWIKDTHDILLYGVYSGDDYKIILYDPAYQFVYQPTVNITYIDDNFVELNKEKAQRFVDKPVENSYIARPRTYGYRHDNDEFQEQLLGWPNETKSETHTQKISNQDLHSIWSEIDDIIDAMKCNRTNALKKLECIDNLKALYMGIDTMYEDDIMIINIFKSLQESVVLSKDYDQILEWIDEAEIRINEYLYESMV
jgi:hypothetical protein